MNEQPEFDVIQEYEFVTVEEAKRRGLKVPENAGSVVQIFAYRPLQHP